jgi:multiple antibiotic resistance protein
MLSYSNIITLFVVMDSLGTVPILLTLIKDYSPQQRRKIIIRESLIACFILLVFALIGEFILEGLGLTTAALSIAGGLNA